MECDSYVIRSYQERRHIITLLNRLQLPVYFRLLYSSGMRTCEVRWLKCSDVNFESGIVKIIKSKSIDEHVIVLHDSMLQLLQNYNQAMEKVMPNRIYLFLIRKTSHTRYVGDVLSLKKYGLKLVMKRLWNTICAVCMLLLIFRDGKIMVMS